MNFSETITPSNISEDDSSVSHNTRWIVFGLTNIVFLAIGIPGNILVILSLRRMSHCAINYLLTNLAVSHLVYIFTLAVEYSMTSQWVLGETLCSFLPYLENISLFVCPCVTLTAISVNRFLRFWFTEKDKFMKTLHNSTIGMLLIWIFSGILTLPMTFLKGISEDEDGQQTQCLVSRFRSMFYVYRLCILIVSCTVMVVLYSLIFYKFASVMKIVSQNQLTDNDTQRNRKTDVDDIHLVENDIMTIDETETIEGLRMLVVISILPGVCVGPLLVSWLFVSPFSETEICLEILANTYCCLCPLIYYFMSIKFRKRYRRILTK